MEKEKVFIVDASVAIKWFSPEESRDKALQIRDDFINELIEIAVPELLFYEVANALRYSRVLRVGDVRGAVSALLDMQLTMHTLHKELLNEAVDMAYNYGITVYDAVYLALAKRLNSRLYTVDRELVRKASKYVKHLSMYSS